MTIRDNASLGAVLNVIKCQPAFSKLCNGA